VESDKLKVESVTVGAQPPGRLNQPRTHTESTERVWISTDDRLPDPATAVLVCVIDQFDCDQSWIDLGEFYEEQWLLVGAERPLRQGCVSHWMPLPEPPTC